MLFKTYLRLGLLFIAFFSVEASLTSSRSGDQTVNEGSNVTLFCDATGKPAPNITWTRVLKNGTDGDVLFLGNSWVIVNISRTYTGTYRCTAYNGIRNPVSHSLYINVTCEYRHALRIGEINNHHVLLENNPKQIRALICLRTCFYLTNRFHVAVILFSNRSRMA